MKETSYKIDARIIIAGGRDFHDYEMVKKACDKYTKDKYKSIEIVCGMAKGADTLGKKWGEDNGYDIAKFPADWNKYKNAAGPIRNKQMAEYGNVLIAFWDTKSKGTKNMIDTARDLGLEIVIFKTI
jgi:hypothetical protein